MLLDPVRVVVCSSISCSSLSPLYLPFPVSIVNQRSPAAQGTWTIADDPSGPPLQLVGWRPVERCGAVDALTKFEIFFLHFQISLGHKNWC